MFKTLRLRWYLMRLESCNSYVRDAAAKALAKLDDSRVAEILIERLDRRNVDDRREAAARALGETGDRRAIEPLISMLADTNSGVRCAAARALCRLGEPQWRYLVQGNIDDVSRLGHSRDTRVCKPLLAWLGERDSFLRGKAAEALGELGDSRAVEPLIVKLSDEDKEVRQAAVEALRRLGDNRAVEPLLGRLTDGADGVRLAAVRALAKLAGARAVGPIVVTLADIDAHVRGAAAGALGMLGDGRAVEPLLAVLGDNSFYVRLAAAQALERLGQPQWKSLIRGDDGDFGRLGDARDPRLVEALVAGLHHARIGVRRVVVEALLRIARSNPSALGDRTSHIAVLVHAPHNDEYHGHSSDCSGHTDEGIGMEWPDF